MRIEPTFNPLDKRNLGVSVAEALLGRPRNPLPPSESFIAAGVYAIYYQGDFAHYESLAARNRANNGNDADMTKAKRFAASEGYTVFCYTGEKDPLNKARKDIAA